MPWGYVGLLLVASLGMPRLTIGIIGAERSVDVFKLISAL